MIRVIALLCTVAAPAAADISERFGPATDPNNPVGKVSPPASFQGQHWVSPKGCSYSRAQAPGYAPTWHLILNGKHVGLTDAHSGCPVRLQSASGVPGKRY